MELASIIANLDTEGKSASDIAHEIMQELEGPISVETASSVFKISEKLASCATPSSGSGSAGSGSCGSGSGSGTGSGSGSCSSGSGSGSGSGCSSSRVRPVHGCSRCGSTMCLGTRCLFYQSVPVKTEVLVPRRPVPWGCAICFCASRGRRCPSCMSGRCNLCTFCSQHNGIPSVVVPARVQPLCDVYDHHPIYY